MAAGIPGAWSRRHSVLQLPQNTSSSSAAARRPSLPRPVRAARPSGPLAGPLLSGAPTQAHGSMKQKIERERCRPPRLRLDQERRWGTRTAPPPPVFLSRESGAAGLQAPGVKVTVLASWGRGPWASGKGGGRRARPAGPRVPNEGGGPRHCWEWQAVAPALGCEARRSSRSFPHALR